MENNIDVYFYQLIVSIQMSVMHHLSNESTENAADINKNRELARNGIETLSMLTEKTSGNLTEEEDRFLNQALFELRTELDKVLKK